MSVVIEIRGLRKEFGDLVAVEDVHLDIEEGEFFTLLGPSGSGKTTVLRMIAGLERPTSGEIYLGGTEVADDAPYERDVNTVFQDYALFPHMTVGENIAYGLELRDASQSDIDDRIEELLELVSLTGLADRQINELSGGQQQRVALARALAIEPRVLLLDEPLGALDEKLRREMQVELKQIQETLGTTFIYVTHDQEEALSMSDRLAVMDSGQVIQVGPPDEVYEQPRTEFIARFFRGSNIFEGEQRQSGDDDTVVISALETEITAKKVDFDIGEIARFFVRSENIHVGSDENTVSGHIENILYRGELTDYTVRLDSGHQFTATLSSEEYEDGDQLTLGWSAADTILLHPDAE